MKNIFKVAWRFDFSGTEGGRTVNSGIMLEYLWHRMASEDVTFNLHNMPIIQRHKS